MTAPLTLATFIEARLAEDEAAARACAEAFPSPWEVADRGWRVRIYAADVPDIGDHAEPSDMRAPCVIEVEPQRHHRELNDGGWLSDRVEHIARHDPARVLADVAAKRAIVAMHNDHEDCDDQVWGPIEPTFTTDWTPVYDGMVVATQQFVGCKTLMHLAQPYADHPDFDPTWTVS